MGQWPHYGGGAQGWAKRFGANLGRHGIAEIHPHFCPLDDPAARSSLFSFAQKIAYFPVWYSAARVVVTKNDSGDSTFNSSEFLGALFTSGFYLLASKKHDQHK